MNGLCVVDTCDPRTAAPGLRLCAACAGNLVRNLREAARVYEALVERHIGSKGTGEKVSGSSSPAIPYADSAGDARTFIRQRLGAWAAYVAKQRQVRPPGSDVHACVSFLISHADYVAGHESAGDAFQQIYELAWGQPRNAAYPGGSRAIQRVTTCPAIVRGGNRCNADAVAVLRRPDSLYASEIVCTVDASHRWTSGEWLRVFGDGAHVKCVTTNEAATALGIDPSGVRYYVQRGRLTRLEDGRIDLEEVRRLYAELWAVASDDNA